MITYKVKPGSKLSQTWLTSLKFTLTNGFFQAIDREDIGFNAVVFGNEFIPESLLWSNKDMLDFANTTRLMLEDYPTIDIEALQKWYFSK